ncbi:non-heme iron oxygenase ferredoxin subunit [Candidatus Woesearchaeota archaeon]|nr:non-heme iron oxygenase ferredoxin subunit [Candidatus Woesearchaeota archaeon]
MATVKIGKKSDFSEGANCVEANGRKLAVFNIGGKLHCIDGTCTHRGGPLCEGELDGNLVTCPWHGAQFDVSTGKVEGPPAEKDVKSYKVTIKGDDVFVEM